MQNPRYVSMMLFANTGITWAASQTANAQQNGGFNVVNLNQGNGLSAWNKEDIQ